jgi:hypothetical protein
MLNLFKYFIPFFLMFPVAEGFAQTPSFNSAETLIPIQVSSSNYYPVMLLDNMGRKINRSVVKDAEGTPYLFNDWRKAKVETADGKTFVVDKIKLHLQAGELHWMNPQQQIIVVQAGTVKNIRFIDSLTPDSLQLLYATGFPAIDMQDQNTWYRVLTKGKFTLLEYQQKKLRTGKNELSGLISSEFVDVKDLYVVRDGKIVAMKRNKKGVVGYFSEYAVQLNAYLQSREVDFKSNEDLAQLFREANKW